MEVTGDMPPSKKAIMSKHRPVKASVSSEVCGLDLTMPKHKVACSSDEESTYFLESDDSDDDPDVLPLPRSLHDQPHLTCTGSSSQLYSSMEAHPAKSVPCKEKRASRACSDVAQMSSSRVKVLTTNNTGNNRKWDKRHYCPYCMKATPKLPRHLLHDHPKEIEVQQVQSLPLKSRKRKVLLDVLRNKGNHQHNLQVLKAKSGFLIPHKRPKYETDASLYLPCDQCFGYFVRSDMWKHKKKCVMKDALPDGRLMHTQRKSVQTQYALLVPITEEVSSLLKEKAFGQMMPYEVVSLVARNDNLVPRLGTIGQCRTSTSIPAHHSKD